MRKDLPGAPVCAASRAWTDVDTNSVGSHELIRRATDPLELMQRVADQAVAMIEGAQGGLVGLLVDAETLRFVCGSGHLAPFVGETMKLDGSLSGRAIRTRSTLITDDTESDGRVNRKATRAFDVRSSVCVPLGRGQEPIGILNISAPHPRAFDEHDVALLSSLADFMSTVIGAASDFMAVSSRLLHARHDGERRGGEQRADDSELAGRFVASVLDPHGAARLANRELIESVIARRDFELIFQPIYSLEKAAPTCFEALARFGPSAGTLAPDAFIAQAHAAGLGAELELLLVRSALEHLGRLPGGAPLAVNAGPQALASRPLMAAFADVPPERLVVELTEHVAVEDYPLLAAALEQLRERGIRLAIDDAGAGFSSLTHILKLAPDFIKLDRQLVSGIDLDPVRQCLAGSLVRFAEETGAAIVAEGVESAPELAVLRDLGIHDAQGFYLARPTAIRDLAQVTRRGAARVRAMQGAGAGTGVPDAAVPGLARAGSGAAPA